MRLLLSLLVFLPLLAFRGNDGPSFEWRLKRNTQGIKVFVRDVTGSNLKELKIETSFDASLDEVYAAVQDANNYKNWVYRLTSSRALKDVSVWESYDYYLIDFPWPMDDRDMITHSVATQDAKSKVLTIQTSSSPNYLGTNPDIVRIRKHSNKWVLKPVAPNKVELVYTLQSDPGGAIPDWVINMAIDNGPFQSMSSFRKLVQNGTYKGRKLDYLQDY